MIFLKNKRLELSEAVKEVPENGCSISFGGFAITRNPIAFVNEMIRQKKKSLDIYQVIAGMDTELLVGAGSVKSLSYSAGSLDRFGRFERINEAINKGEIDVREYTLLSLEMRFLAGSMGIPFIPNKSLLGTDMLNDLIVKNDDAIRIEISPFDNERYVYLKQLQPDIVVIHAQYADEKGNIIIEGPSWDLEVAKSAKKLYVTVEKIVSSEYIKRHCEKVVIPSVFTHAVIEVPFGAFPTAVYKAYDYDSEFLTYYAKINKNAGDFNNYLNEYVYGTRNHDDFLNKTGGFSRLKLIIADPVSGY